VLGPSWDKIAAALNARPGKSVKQFAGKTIDLRRTARASSGLDDLRKAGLEPPAARHPATMPTMPRGKDTEH
jgi:hypothetical protein